MKRRQVVPAILMFALVAGVSLVPGGAGNVGRPGTLDTATGGGTVEMTQAGEFTVVTTPGQSMTSIRDALVAQINASPMMYVASSAADPNDPNVASLTVTRMGGVEANHLKICTNDSGINHAGISFVGGKSFAILNSITAVAGDGNYRIQVDSTAADVDANIPTNVAPNNTPAGLNTSICSALTGAGYTCDRGTFGSILISRPGGQILAVRVTATDSAISSICVDITNDLATGSIPTLSQYGMFVLVLLMTGAAIVVMRRKAAASR